jgi:putative protease
MPIASPVRPELLSPAGDWDCARAAVANGADAIYFGLNSGFNARARAANFEVGDLPALMAFLHRHNVRGYVTLNTLVFSDELEEVESLVREIAVAGADAVLVQDLGLVRLIRAVCPDLPIHASTQMTMTSAECIAEIEPLGVERVVLARELSVDEIGAIHSHTSMPLEVFVHGALCVAYSGQCLTSESLGGRSANRGQCAQACRLPYELICDERDVDLGLQKYLLSPQDLAAYALVPDLIAAGATCFKIEGRLKTPVYVANITRHYREAIDSTLAGKPVEFTPREVEEMELSFSRGFSPGWLQGCDHKMLVPATSSAKRGVLIGEVHGIQHGRVCATIRGRIKAGDGVAFEGDRAEGEDQGGRIFGIRRDGTRLDGEASGGDLELEFASGTVDLPQLRPGQRIWKTDDPALTRRLQQSFTGKIHGRERAVRVMAAAAVGEPLRIVVAADGLPNVACETEQPLAAAVKHPLTRELLEEQLGRLGGSGFVLRELIPEITGAPMAPLSVLGRLRRDMVARLTAARDALVSTRRIASEPVLPRLRAELAHGSDEPTEPVLSVLCRSLPQLQAALACAVKTVYVDLQDIREFREAVALGRASGADIWLATPRIQKPGETGIFRAMLRHEADGILVRNLSGLAFFNQQGTSCVVDFSLNAANELTVAELLGRGAARVTPSFDLNRDQLLGLLEHTSASRLEIVVHQHMPMFHMEHCVFCAVLSPGTNKTNCGRPCDHHQVRLRDRIGAEHPLKADVGCRNTVFNAIPQSGAELVPELLQHGVRHFRIELLDDAPEDIGRTIDLYRRLLLGEATGRDVWTALRAMNRVGVTRGTLEERRNPLAIV